MCVATTLSANCIETERLRQRKARNGDADGIVEIQIDERVRRYLGGPRPVQETRALVESVAAAQLLSGGRLHHRDKESDEMLGMIALEWRDPSCRVTRRTAAPNSS